MIHDAFQPLSYWEDFMPPPNWQDVMIDTHIYEMFSNQVSLPFELSLLVIEVNQGKPNEQLPTHRISMQPCR